MVTALSTLGSGLIKIVFTKKFLELSEMAKKYTFFMLAQNFYFFPTVPPLIFDQGHLQVASLTDDNLTQVILESIALFIT